MDWQSWSVLAGSIASTGPPPPCIGLVNGDVILTDSLDHVNCYLTWYNRMSKRSSVPDADVVTFTEVDVASPQHDKEDILIVVIGARPSLGDLLEDYQHSIRFSIIQCAKSRFPAFTVTELITTVDNITTWKTTRPHGTVLFVSEGALSKQILLFLATALASHPQISIDDLASRLEQAKRDLELESAKKHSFLVRPSHPSPLLSIDTLFPSQIRMLKTWRMLKSPYGTFCGRQLRRLVLSISRKTGRLLSTFGDAQPTIELWRRAEEVLSSRPSLTRNNMEPDSEVAVKGLELSNSVIRRSEGTSFRWECEVCGGYLFHDDILVRLLNESTMLRVQLHSQQIPHQAGLVLTTSEIDGCDLCGGEDDVRLELSFE